jgi:hypothetical protein
MTDLFGRLATDNMSWDSLLTATTYNAFPRNAMNFIDVGDFGFFRGLFPQLPDESRGTYGLGDTSDPTKVTDAVTTPVGPVPINLPANDLRVAGALTTDRFIGRYATTALNKNRRRAAAVYNIALCDPMLPSVVTGNDPKHDFLDKSFANKFEVSAEQVSQSLNESAEALHGSNADCKACHMKLDPMGKTFQNIGTTLNPEPGPGALVIPRAANKILLEKVAGIGELTRKIVQQPEYVDCQTQYLWTEFIGDDVPMTTTRLNAIRCEFEKSSRKTNDFIKKLVTSQDFRIEPTDRGQLLFNDVKDLLKRCDSCHATEQDIPMMSVLPIIDVDGTNGTLKWMKRIVGRINLPESSDKRMPKDWKTNWSDNDLGRLRRWLNEGAKDADGKMTIAPVPQGDSTQNRESK